MELSLRFLLEVTFLIGISFCNDGSSVSEDSYSTFDGYDIDLGETEKLGGELLGKASSNKLKGLMEKCKLKCSAKFDADCNIVVYQPAKVQCLLMDCGVDSANCYFFEAESKKTNKNNAPVIFKRTKAQVEQEPDNDKDEDSETGKDSSAEVGYETTDVRNHDVTSERPESVDETTVLEGEEETERDPFQFPSSPNEDGTDPAIPGPFDKDDSNVHRCDQPSKVGPCRAAMPRYFFNTVTKECEMFIYGGCNANRNNFVSLVDCQIACRKGFSDSSLSSSSTDKVTEVPEKRNGGNNDSSVQFVNDSSSSHHSNSFTPINSAHRGQVESRVASGNLSTVYQLEALVPLFVGILISLLMIFIVVFRCYINSKKGPKKLRKMVYDGPPPTVGEHISDDEVVNGMYA
ncbi:amyloid-beta precursor protein-like [Symsagittifera roscoffensis]|uniref:amyloid-beta precursor protein-like n=1 Tax=Symsagittifera roscoffensis TaxID=84072 RepID=UPI00307C6FC2